MRRRAIQATTQKEITLEVWLERRVQGGLFELWQDTHDPAFAITLSGESRPLLPWSDANRQHAIRVMVVMNGQPQLLNVVGTLHPPRRLPRNLYRRKQQSYQYTNDRNHNEKLDKGERSSSND